MLQLEQTQSLQEVALKFGRDHSVVSRSLKKISEKLAVVDKKAGRWILTELGKKFNEATRALIATQTSLSQTQQSIRIGTNREFAARIVGPDLNYLMGLFPDTIFTINSYENGTEEVLLNGQIDIGIDCDRPNDPEIAYKLLIDEPIIVVCSDIFLKANRKRISDYLELPHLLCERLHPDKVLSKLENHPTTVARFNDVATTRSACLQGLGWALLPAYAIQEELDSKRLIQIDKQFYGKSKYGLRWVRKRSYLKNSVEILSQWLQSKKLS